MKGYFIPRHMILVEKFDYSSIRGILEKIVSNAERENLQESMKILCRYFAWEFEDYQIS